VIRWGSAEVRRYRTADVEQLKLRHGAGYCRVGSDCRSSHVTWKGLGHRPHINLGRLNKCKPVFNPETIAVCHVVLSPTGMYRVLKFRSISKKIQKWPNRKFVIFPLRFPCYRARHDIHVRSEQGKGACI
jgi:hypothetical protein